MKISVGCCPIVGQVNKNIKQRHFASRRRNRTTSTVKETLKIPKTV